MIFLYAHIYYYTDIVPMVCELGCTITDTSKKAMRRQKLLYVYEQSRCKTLK